MPPLIFNVGLFLGRRYWGDVKGLFCVSVGRLSRYTQCPNQEHWDALARLMKYL